MPTNSTTQFISRTHAVPAGIVKTNKSLIASFVNTLRPDFAPLSISAQKSVFTFISLSFVLVIIITFSLSVYRK